MAAQGDKLDLVIFGATGYTGKVAVEEAVKLTKEKSVTWGIAGRSQSKLENVLKEVSEKTGEDVTKVPIIIADVSDEESLKQMAARARVVVNCVGPYRFYGETVVKSCVTSGTHHVDISGEPQFLESMQLEYHDVASDKGVYIVGACGMDSIPTDMGVVFLKKQLSGDLNSVEVYLKIYNENRVEGSTTSLNYGTYESAVYSVANYNELRPLRSKLFPNRLPVMKPKLQPRAVAHQRDDMGWCVPFMGSDRSVIIRSQRHFFEVEKERPTQVQVYMVVKSLLSVMLLAVFGFFFLMLARFQFGRNLLLKYPRFFTAGLVGSEGPSEEYRKSVRYQAILYGEGWTEKVAEPTDQHSDPPNKKVVVKVTCKDPGYGSTTVMLLLSAITILRESDKMPGRGGVYPTAAAFSKTSLIDELNKHGIKFEVVSSTEN